MPQSLRAACLLILLLALGACSALRVDRAASVAAGYTSLQLCAGYFVSGLSPDRSYEELIRPLPGSGLVRWGLDYELDPEAETVQTSIAGMIVRRAQHRPGAGCVLLPADGSPARTAPLSALPSSEAAALPREINPRLQAQLEASIDPAPDTRIRALLVLHRGRIVAEHYAAGITAHTQLPGFSLSKSVTSALAGLLVGAGRLRLDAPVPVPEWAKPEDPRHAITLDQLLRQTSGLDLPQTNSGFDLTSQIMFREGDTAAAAARTLLAATPGTWWNYSDAQYMLLSRLLLQASGGSEAGFLQFARQAFFEPLGMRDTTIQFDAAGTPMGANFIFASARDWARFGQLYLDGGRVGDRALLPPGWVAYSATPTQDTGYGAGFWTNRVAGQVPAWGAPWGLPHAPADTFFARGFFGQLIAVIPSEQLVFVRLGAASRRGDDIAGTDRILATVLAALHEAH
ncbi:serine hydrolase [Niveibacterium sp. SC-1]|uniref:serine hydrolase domain-containing protein n=1 Tax=Niveibacterium sp. SC-1 TaxID=3135646 RepID=UPI00311F03D1